MDPKATDDLTNAVVAWLSAVVPRLARDKQEFWQTMLDGRCDVRVAIRLRQGTIILEAIDDAQGRRAEMYREDIGPLRPDTGFATPDTSRKQ